jgi:hypothetical protein
MERKRGRGRIGKVVSEGFGFRSCFRSVLLFLFFFLTSTGALGG